MLNHAEVNGLNCTPVTASEIPPGYAPVKKLSPKMLCVSRVCPALFTDQVLDAQCAAVST